MPYTEDQNSIYYYDSFLNNNSNLEYMIWKIDKNTHEATKLSIDEPCYNIRIIDNKLFYVIDSTFNGEHDGILFNRDLNALDQVLIEAKLEDF